MSANEMIERVAQAIEDKGEMSPLAWEEMPEFERDWFRDLARAAISAMREPTENMIAATGKCAIADGAAIHSSPDYGQAWQAMIDAALSGPEGEALR